MLIKWTKMILVHPKGKIILVLSNHSHVYFSYNYRFTNFAAPLLNFLYRFCMFFFCFVIALPTIEVPKVSFFSLFMLIAKSDRNYCYGDKWKNSNYRGKRQKTDTKN